MSKIKVKVENYQAIINADLEFDVGLTAIVGPTNSGKSSLIRAIKGAINNQTGTGFINYNADEAKVTIAQDDNTVVWTKPKRGSGTYTLNGREISKVGRTQNEEVADLLNMSEIEVNNVKIRLNFWEQMEKAFLMDKTPNQLFEFISQSKEQELMTNYQNIEQSNLKDLEQDIKTNETRLDLINKDTQDLEERAKALEKFTAIDVETLELLEELKEEIEDNLYIIKNTTEETAILEKRITSLKNRVKNSEVIMAKAKELKTDKETLQAALTAYINSEQNLIGVEDNIDNLKPKIADLETKATKIEKIIKDIKELGSLKSNVEEQNTKYKSADNNVKSTESQIDTLKDNIKNLEEELSEFNMCPFCGSELNENHSTKHEN